MMPAKSWHHFFENRLPLIARGSATKQSISIETVVFGKLTAALDREG
jgi:hypothetical protein